MSVDGAMSADDDAQSERPWLAWHGQSRIPALSGQLFNHLEHCSLNCYRKLIGPLIYSSLTVQESQLKQGLADRTAP